MRYTAAAPLTPTRLGRWLLALAWWLALGWQWRPGLRSALGGASGADLAYPPIRPRRAKPARRGRAGRPPLPYPTAA